jgi:hypothetical protein
MYLKILRFSQSVIYQLLDAIENFDVGKIHKSLFYVIVALSFYLHIIKSLKGEPMGILHKSLNLLHITPQKVESSSV